MNDLLGIITGAGNAVTNVLNSYNAPQIAWANASTVQSQIMASMQSKTMWIVLGIVAGVVLIFKFMKR